MLFWKKSPPLTAVKPPPVDPVNDWISPADPVSRLRRIQLRTRPNELEVERQFRLQHDEVQRWNHEFWTKHNTSFLEEQRKFMHLHKDQADTEQLMSKFYKQFLDKSWKLHYDYNRDWYIKNAQLLWSAFKVVLYKTVRRIKP